jgi:hypothetical protein
MASVNCCDNPAGVIVARGSIFSVSGCVYVVPPTISLTMKPPGSASTPSGSRGVSR